MKRTWWDVRAAELQAANRDSEGRKNERYTEEQTRRAAVYTREDLVMVVSHLSALNAQLAILCRLLVALVVIAAIALGKYLL